MGDSTNLQNPKQPGLSTVPTGTAPRNDSPNVPQQVQKGGYGNIPAIPSKPAATTGPGGPSISIPKVGKSGK